MSMYARKAREWSDTEYADADAYLDHRADLVLSLGPPLVAGDEVLDLACADAGLGGVLLERGLRYRGVDNETAMVEAARRRLGGRATIELGDLDLYAPPAPVAATTVFRAIYYSRDRTAFFRRAAEFTEKKLIFDLNPRQFPVRDVIDEVRAAGLNRVELRPFFVPQARRLPGPALALLKGAECCTPVARVVLRSRFTYLVSASR